MVLTQLLTDSPRQSHCRTKCFILYIKNQQLQGGSLVFTKLLKTRNKIHMQKSHAIPKKVKQREIERGRERKRERREREKEKE